MPALVASMNDPDRHVCWAACISLAYIGTPEAVEALEKAAKSSDQQLRERAAFSLRRMEDIQNQWELWE